MTIPISLIVAMARRNVIGVYAHNNMPWHMPADLKYFREKTRYKPVIMGRKTYDSIGKPLVDRMNFVVSRNQDLNLSQNSALANVQVCHSLQEAIERAHLYIQQYPIASRYHQTPQKEGGGVISDAEDEMMIIGGASLFEQALPIAHRLYLTKIHAEVEGDVYFPIWDDPKEKSDSLWQQISQVDHQADEKNPYDYSFYLYAKKER
jgi:dihydrofolate reductase